MIYKLSATLEKTYESGRSWDLLIVGLLLLIPTIFQSFLVDLSFLSFSFVKIYLFGFVDEQGFHSYFEPMSLNMLFALLLWIAMVGNSLMVFLCFPKKQNKLRIKKSLKASGVLIFAVLLQYIVIVFFSTANESPFGYGFYLYLILLIFIMFRVRYLRKNDLLVD